MNHQARKRQAGFTLVEIAIVLVIIGLLLGGILKGQELINSARVRNLADTATGIQAAYYGFVDRYRRVPGDWSAPSATLAIGQTITGGGNDNGRIDHTTAAEWTEVNALWEQLALAGFIQGSYLGTAATLPTNINNLAPLNAFNNLMAVARGSEYMSAPVGSKLYLILGRGVPATVMRELDLKLDDGVPDRGDMRATIADGTASVLLPGATGGFSPIQSEAGCTAAITGPPASTIWDIATDSQDCNAIYIF